MYVNGVAECWCEGSAVSTRSIFLYHCVSGDVLMKIDLDNGL